VAEIAAEHMSGRSERRFFSGMTVLSTAIILWGFAPSFFLRGIVPPVVHSYLDPPPQPIRWLYITHGLVFSVWVTLCLTQVFLVSSGRSALHRRAGRVAFILAPMMVILGLIVSSYATRNGFHDVTVPSATAAIVPVSDIALYAAFVSAALLARRQPQAHKRWMLFAMIAIAEAGWARIAVLNPESLPLWLSTELVLLLPIIAWDLWRLGRLTIATAWGCIAIAGVFSLRYWLGATPGWLALMAAVSG
jgi:hypothetical protein